MHSTTLLAILLSSCRIATSDSSHTNQDPQWNYEGDFAFENDHELENAYKSNPQHWHNFYDPNEAWLDSAHPIHLPPNPSSDQNHITKREAAETKAKSNKSSKSSKKSSKSKSKSKGNETKGKTSGKKSKKSKNSKKSKKSKKKEKDCKGGCGGRRRDLMTPLQRRCCEMGRSSGNPPLSVDIPFAGEPIMPI